ncbi:MAG: DUF1559 domain-containing protein [Planctomycetes bacterium]|nr:DUF1559 domain-containing protein [Planctomycetota bacterium]
MSNAKETVGARPPSTAHQAKVSGRDTSHALTAARSMHAGGVHVALCDGSARFISENLNLGIWRGLATRCGGELLGEY